MTNQRLNINISSLWENPENKFILRYRDISNDMQIILAKRIKTIAPQWSIRRETGPTIEQIKNTLAEINPIIFGENTRNPRYGNSYRSFNVLDANYIAGWVFHSLCQAIYKILCVKRRLNSDEIHSIIYLITRDRNITRSIIDEYYGTIHSTREQPPELPTVEELGLEEISNIRECLANNRTSTSEAVFLNEGARRERQERINTDPTARVMTTTGENVQIQPTESSEGWSIVVDVNAFNRLNYIPQGAFEDTEEGELNN